MLWLPDIKLVLEGLWIRVFDQQKKDYKDCDYLTNKGLEERRSVWQPWRPQVADCCSPALWSYKKDFPLTEKKQETILRIFLFMEKTWQNLDAFPISGKKNMTNLDDFPKFAGK